MTGEARDRRHPRLQGRRDQGHQRLPRGMIAEELAGDAPVFSSDSYELLKFHGIYQQDDRDVRAERKRL